MRLGAFVIPILSMALAAVAYKEGARCLHGIVCGTMDLRQHKIMVAR